MKKSNQTQISLYSCIPFFRFEYFKCTFNFCLQDKGKATMYGSRRLHKDKKLDLLLMEDSDPDDSDPEDVKAMKSEEEFKKVKRMPGMYYKVMLSTTLT